METYTVTLIELRHSIRNEKLLKNQKKENMLNKNSTTT